MSEIVQDEHEGKLLFQNEENNKFEFNESDGKLTSELTLRHTQSVDEVGVNMKSKKKRDLYKKTKGGTGAILSA